MSTADWIGLVPSLIVVLGVGIGLIVKLTRLTDSVDRLTKTVGNPEHGLVAKVEHIDHRLTAGGL